LKVKSEKNKSETPRKAGYIISKIFKFKSLIFNPKRLNIKFFTKQQLARRNGQDRDEIWVAYQGKIYDVTTSRLWRKGQHYEHWAGQDLTDELSDAPHTEKVFEKFEVVGVLI